MLRTEKIAVELNLQRNAFKAFLTARVGSEADAEDLLQNGLLKALQRAGELQDDAKLTAWFYQLLRNAVIDHYRARGSVRRKHDALGEMISSLGEDISAAPKGWEAQLCGCLGGVVDTLKPQQAELLRRVDLEGESVQGDGYQREQRQCGAVSRPQGIAGEASGFLWRMRRRCVPRL